MMQTSNASSLVALGMALASVSISQLIFKARFLALGADTAGVRDWRTLLVSALTDGYLWVGGMFLLVGVASWYYAMIRLPLSLMLPMAAVITPIVSVAAFILFGEDLTAAKFAAILVILTGVAWLGWLNA